MQQKSTDASLSQSETVLQTSFLLAEERQKLLEEHQQLLEENKRLVEELEDKMTTSFSLFEQLYKTTEHFQTYYKHNGTHLSSHKRLVENIFF